jgi:hypothetical protein
VILFWITPSVAVCIGVASAAIGLLALLVFA